MYGSSGTIHISTSKYIRTHSAAAAAAATAALYVATTYVILLLLLLLLAAAVRHRTPATRGRS